MAMTLRLPTMPRRPGPRMARRLAFGALALPMFVSPAYAHPHVWVSVETTVQAERGAFTGLRQRWTFDEFYSSMAIEGLDTNKDGVLDRQELAELAKVNMEGLKEFAYFTFAQLAGQKLGFSEPADVTLEHVTIDQPPGPTMEPLPDAAPSTAAGTPSAPPTQATEGQAGSFFSRAWDSLLGKGEPPPPQKPKVLVLEFTLPLQQPVLAEAEGFQVSTYDPSFFIWFDLAKDNPARLAGSVPAGCKAGVREGEKDGGDLQRLGESFFNTMGGPNLGGSVAKTVVVDCPKL